MIFKKDEFRLLWPFYLYCLVMGLSLMVDAYFIIYFIDLGYSFVQVSMLFSSYFLTMFLFEIPTGAFADSFSRKYSVIIGLLIAGISVAMMPLSKNFCTSILLWIITGIGITFISGAEEAWVVSNLKKSKREDLLSEYFIKSSSLASVGAVIAPLVAAILIKTHPISLLWQIFGVGFVASGIILFVFAEEKARPKNNPLFSSLAKLFSTSREGLKIIISRKVILLLIIGNCFVAMMALGFVAQQPFLVSLGMEKVSLGVFFSVLSAFSILVYFSARFFVKYHVPHFMMFLTGIRTVILIGFLFLSKTAFMLAAVFFILFDGLKKIKDPVLQPYFHKFVPEKSRATIGSINNMSTSLIFAAGTLIAGILLEYYEMKLVIASGFIFGVLAIATYSLIKIK